MMIMTLFTQKHVCVRGLVLTSHVHLPVTYFLFHDTTSHLVLALSGSLRPKYGTPYLFTSANLKLTLPSDVILRRTTFCQPILPPSGPCNAPWFSFETLALYKSLTYLLITEKDLADNRQDSPEQICCCEIPAHCVDDMLPTKQPPHSRQHCD